MCENVSNSISIVKRSWKSVTHQLYVHLSAKQMHVCILPNNRKYPRYIPLCSVGPLSICSSCSKYPGTIISIFTCTPIYFHEVVAFQSQFHVIMSHQWLPLLSNRACIIGFWEWINIHIYINLRCVVTHPFRNSSAVWLTVFDIRAWLVASSYENISRVTGFCQGNPPVTDGFPSQRPMTRSFMFYLICA